MSPSRTGENYRQSFDQDYAAKDYGLGPATVK
jgi:hypothetical protein